MTNTKKKLKVHIGSISSPIEKISYTKTPTKSIKKESKKKIESAVSTEFLQDDENCAIDNHPIAIGQDIIVRYRDGSSRLSKIVESQCQIDSSGTSTWQYYIHYHDFNRRMDEWISSDRILVYPSELESEKKQLFRETTKEIEEIQKFPKTDNQHSKTNQANILTITTVADHDHDEHEGLDAASLKEHEEITKIKNVTHVLLGKYKTECWYFSPFPSEYYPSGHIDCLYFCEFTFRFFRTKSELIRYQKKPSLPRHPPGNEIYRDGKVSMFELDGAVEKVYCQNLCYFAKLFLDHKTLYWDVDPFLFYVLNTYDERGFHPVGFFSKEKYSDMGFNLACILTFPAAQRQGYGRFLISFSYELSKKEEKVGTPEKPLSDLGCVGYFSYWASTLVRIIKQYVDKLCTESSEDAETCLSVMDLTKLTSINNEDVTSTLLSLHILRLNSTTNIYYFYCESEYIDNLYLKYCDIPATATNAKILLPLEVDPRMLQWAPLYVMDPKKDKFTLK